MAELEADNIGLRKQLRAHSHAVMGLSVEILNLSPDDQDKVSHDDCKRLINAWRIKWDAANKEANEVLSAPPSKWKEQVRDGVLEEAAKHVEIYVANNGHGCAACIRALKS